MIDWQDDAGGGTATYSSDNPFAGAAVADTDPQQGKSYSPDNPFAKAKSYSADNPFAKPAAPRTPAPATVVRPPKAGEAGQINLADPATPNEISQAHTRSTDLAAIARPASTDAMRLRAPGEAPAGPDPVATAISATGTIAAAPVVSAAKAGLFLGQKANDLTEAYKNATDENYGRDDNAATANELLAAAGLPTITDKEALLSAAQLAAMGFGGYAGKLAGRLTAGIASKVIGAAAKGTSIYTDGAPEASAITKALVDHAPQVVQGLAGTVEHGVGGGLVGASYDPDNPFRGAAIGAGLGIAANEVAGAVRRGATPVAAPATETDASRLLANPVERPTATTTVADRPTPSTEPDFTLADLDKPKLLTAGTPEAVPENTDVVPSKHEFSSTQFNLPPESANKLVGLGATIPDADLAEGGREDAPHITVKYGLHGDEPGQLRELLADQPPITVTLGKTSVFPAGESGNGDVLKADVESPELHALNAKIADALPHTDTHPEYVPHATIAYLKPGLGDKYAGDDSLAGHTMTFDHLTFSGKDGTTVDIPLGGAPTSAAPKEPPPAPEKTPGLGRVIDDDGVARLETARTPGGARRPVASVSTNGLLQELLDLEPKRAAAENRAPYEVREDKSFATSGFPQIVSTKDKNGGPSMQAKAARNLADFQRITDEIFAELNARGIDNYSALDRIEDLRAQNDERAGMAGDWSHANLGRGAVRDDSGKVLFAEAPGTSTSSARASGSARKAAPPNPPAPAGTPRFQTPQPAPLTQRIPAFVAQSVANHISALRNTLAPSTVSFEAGKTARVFRQELGAEAHDYEQAVASLKQFAHMFDRMSVPETRAFIDNMERNLDQATPELTAAAKALRELMDTLRDRIRGLGTGRLENFIEHYFPHVWKDPTTASAVFARMMGAKRPFEGSKSFLKQRTIPLFMDGVQAGLEPVTENPVELVLLKVREMRRYLTAHQTMRRLIDDHLASYVPATMKAPHGLTRLNDAIATVFGPPTVTTSEAFDKHLRGALEQTIKNLNAISPLEHTRKVKLGGGKLGLAHMSGDKMATQFGTHDGVMMHELGHILDARYGLWNKLSADPRTVKELEDLAAERYRGQVVKSSYKKYTKKPPELIANAIHAYLHAPELMGQIAPTTQLMLAKFFASRTELKPLLDAQPSLVLDTGTAEVPVGGIVVKGAYWAPQDVARVFNNHLSPGLRGKPWYDSSAFLNNALNTVQLGLSGFHLGFVALDTSVSQTAVALQNLFAGRFSLAGSQAIQIPAAPVTSFLRGNKLYNAYLSAGTLSPELKQAVEHTIAAGGRVKSDSFYHLGAVDKFLKAIRQGRYGAAAGWSIPAVFDATVKPTLEYYVPRAKLGVFLQLAQHELADLDPTATLDDQLAALQRAWDSVDNRLGQLVYDNLFWGKTFKDLSQIAVRAVGWNLGVLREIPGGAVDLARLGAGAARGKPGDFSAKAAYVASLPIVVGLLGAVTTYLLTGHGPKELRDYYYPPTGRTNPDGDQERLTPPSYVRDVVSYWRHTGDTIVHKLAPFWDLVMSSIENKDFFGDKIRNPDDPFMTRLKQEMQYIGRTAMPLGIQNAREATKREQSTGVKALGFFGMGQAPRDLTRSDAENKIEEYMGSKMPRGATPEESEARRARGDLRLRMRADPKGGGAAADSAEDAGTLTHAQHVNLDRANASDPWLDRFKRLTVEQALNVWKLATPTEQAAWRDALDTKLTRAGRDDEMPPEPRTRFTRP